MRSKRSRTTRFAASCGKKPPTVRPSGRGNGRNSAFGEALDNYTRAFEALGHLPETAARAAAAHRSAPGQSQRAVLARRFAAGRRSSGASRGARERIGDDQRSAPGAQFQNSYYGLVGNTRAGRRRPPAYWRCRQRGGLHTSAVAVITPVWRMTKSPRCRGTQRRCCAAACKASRGLCATNVWHHGDYFQ